MLSSGFAMENSTDSNDIQTESFEKVEPVVVVQVSKSEFIRSIKAELSLSENYNDLQQIEFEEIAGLCRGRICTYRNGVLQGCTDWTYFDCESDVNGGSLEPVVISA